MNNPLTAATGSSNWSRRRFFRTAGGGLAAVSLAGLGTGLAPISAFASTDVDDPDGPVGGTTPQMLATAFRADVRQGPNAGLHLEGTLLLPYDATGAINGGVLQTVDDVIVPVSGQVSGRLIGLSFDLGDRGTIVGTGLMRMGAPVGPGPVLGSLVGPADGDSGDWGSGVDGYACTFISTDGTLYYSSSKHHNIIVRPDLLGAGTRWAGKTDVAGYVEGDRLTAARFNGLRGICIQDNRMFVTDYGNQCIRRVNMTTGVVATVLTLANFRSVYPAASSVGLWGVISTPSFLYISDDTNSCLYKYNLANGQLSLFAGSPGQPGSTDGLPLQARFNHPQDLSITPDNLLINLADFGNGLIRQIPVNGTATRTIGVSTP